MKQGVKEKTKPAWQEKFLVFKKKKKEKRNNYQITHTHC